MKYQQLTDGQRYQISILREDNLSCHEIGIRIGVSKSTVSRELRRNTSDTGYNPQ
ncbi:MAG: helix-turn-helix domain-containing protein, partial [Providencia rustigianii]|uniref:helix-turn-helix domain-containing protein n=1 Tax=Providencia rustigianii TaxID=158850 RepID=UPI003F2BDD74